jgi:hypothetical protein
MEASGNSSDDEGNNSNINTISNKDDAALIQERLLVLLSKQYNHLQDYCNAQIALENAWQLSQQQSTLKQNDLLQAVAELQKATRRVQDDFQSLETMVLALTSSSSPSSSTIATIKDQLPQVPSSSSTNDVTTSPRNRRQRRSANKSADDDGRHHEFQWQVVQAVEQHLQRTRRILHNLQSTTGQFSILGIPLPTSGATNKQEDTIVALATLRASVAQLQSVLEAFK